MRRLRPPLLINGGTGEGRRRSKGGAAPPSREVSRAMPTCARCSAHVDGAAAFCPRCGEALGPGRAARARRRVLALSVTALALAAAAWPAWEGLNAHAPCEPRGWIDWHIAMRQACLTPSYVCHNMTSAKLLEDPALARALRHAFETGDPEPLHDLDALVGQMRARYGCDGALAAPRPAQPRLPPGHPPIGPGEQTPRFAPPSGLDI